MTQPIQEPSNERAIQGMAYARDQIFRRPAVAPLSCCCPAWITLKRTPDITVTTDTTTNMLPNDGAYNFDGFGYYGIMDFVVNPELPFGGTDTLVLQIYQPGVYSVRWNVQPSNPGTTLFDAWMSVQAPIGDSNNPPNRHVHDLISSTVGSNTFLSFTEVVTTGDVEAGESTNPDRNYYGGFLYRHNRGSNLTISIESIHVARWCIEEEIIPG